jgi:hypothetical protein
MNKAQSYLFRRGALQNRRDYSKSAPPACRNRKNGGFARELRAKFDSGGVKSRFSKGSVAKSGILQQTLLLPHLP